jgi:hypothetical protein
MTNVILFPMSNQPVVQLVEYWFKRGYAISNDRFNRLRLVKL